MYELSKLRFHISFPLSVIMKIIMFRLITNVIIILLLFMYYNYTKIHLIYVIRFRLIEKIVKEMQCILITFILKQKSE